jgi:hypothetical protein
MADYGMESPMKDLIIVIPLCLSVGNGRGEGKERRQLTFDLTRLILPVLLEVFSIVRWRFYFNCLCFLFKIK